MTATLTHRHGHKCDLIAALGLPHDTPLIEWHDWTPAAAVVDDLPIAAVGAGGWKYLQISKTDTLNRSAVDYDDSTWATGATQFSNVAPYGTYWAGQTALWLRRTIHTAPGEAVTLAGDIDDWIDVYWNGALIFSRQTGLAAPWGPVTVPAAAVEATNVLAVRAYDNATPQCTVSVGVEKLAPTNYAGPYGWAVNPERTAALIDYTARHGRPTPNQPTDALEGGVRLARHLAGAIPQTGDRFRLTVNPDVAAALGLAEDERPRFTGEITDVDVDAAGDLSVVSVAGLGRRARLNRLPVTMDRPEELDGERVRRILAQVAIDLPVDVGTIDPGTVTLMESSPRAVGALQLFDAVTADSLGQLVEHRSGRLDYHDAGHRRGLTSTVTLTGSEHLIQPFTWRQNNASIINDATATYGPDRDQVRVVDPFSADPDTGAGPYGAQLDTQLAAELDAYALLTNVVGRYARPSWWLPSVLVELYRTAGAALAPVLALTHGDKITATDLPPDGAFTSGDVFVEGTTETHTAGGWRVELVVADPRLAGAGLRWVDLPRFLRWVDVDPALTWLDLATITDPYALGDPVAGAGDADDTPALVVNGGDATTTSWDYVLSGALP